MLYTLETALASRNIEEWVHGYLNTVGNNVPFSEGLKKEKRFYHNPKLMKLEDFERCCGPEPGLKYYEPKANFDMRVHNMVDSLEAGWEMPPLIVKYDKDRYELNDGNHRYEALIQYGVQEYWVILWDSLEKLADEIISKHFSDFEIIEKFENGQIKDIYHFESRGQHYTISISNTMDNCKNELPNIEDVPVKKRMHSGLYKQHYYEIHNMIVGEHNRSISKRYFTNLLEVLTKINAEKIETDDYGFINSQRHETFKEFTNHFFSANQSGYWMNWESLFNDSILEKDVFSHYFNLLSSMSHYCEGKRYLVHGDYSLSNILSINDEITGVLDWDNCMQIDYVYDIVYLQQSFNNEFDLYKHFYKSQGFNTDNFEERVLCMKIFIGLDSLRFYAKNNYVDLYEKRKTELDEFIGIYMKKKNCFTCN